MTVKPRSLKMRAELRKYTPLSPVILCQTRWLSVMQMLERYWTTKDELVNIPGLLPVLLSPQDNAVVKELVEFMVPLKSATIALQKRDLDIASAKLLLSETIKKILELDANLLYVHDKASIIKCKDFENGIAKICNGEDNFF